MGKGTIMLSNKLIKLTKTVSRAGKIYLLALLISIFSFSSMAYAISPSDLDSILNTTTFYDPSSNADCTSAPATSTSGGTVATGQIPPDTMIAINNYKSIYMQAAAATGVPWQLLAAVHYREAGNAGSEDLQAGNPIGGPWPSSAGYPYGHPANLEQSAEFAARQLIAASSTGVVKKPINVPSPDPEAIKDVLFSYNGRADVYAQQAADLGFNPTTQPYEGSPYVMNNYDAVHKNMKIITKDFGGLDGIDTRLGAFTVYSLLLRGAGGDQSSGSGGCTTATSCTSSSTGGSDATAPTSTSSCVTGKGAAAIVQEALNYAWSDNRGDPYCNEKPTYKTAIDAAVSAGQYTGASCDTNSSLHGIDCGGFVTRVMIDSGADPGYNYGGVPSAGASSTGGGQLPYLVANSGPNGKYLEINPNGSTSNLQPGDIAINSDHTFIYMGDQSASGFTENSASASLGTRAPMARPAYFSNGAGAFRWFRLK